MSNYLIAPVIKLNTGQDVRCRGRVFWEKKFWLPKTNGRTVLNVGFCAFCAHENSTKEPKVPIPTVFNE